MCSSKSVPMEDTVKALLDYLVDPALPAKPTARDSPSISQQELVAKQVHAALLLYNYYHRREHPQMEYLGFESFCKLAVVLKPTLIAHMKVMQLSDETDIGELGEELSPTEKAIKDACDLSLSLDASIDVPHTEGWPISKVSVFLVDTKKENCFLLFGSVTQGVWSVIEKDINISDQSSEGTVEAKYVDKKKRILRKAPRDESYVNEAGFQEFAYSAVTKATGIDQSDLLVLESHVVYSLSKEKTVASFYIMQCSQSTNKNVIQVPVKDVINSLRGPLVEHGSCGWTLTPVIEYFHLLPYARILSGWFSREVFPEGLEIVMVELGNVNVGVSKRTEEPCDGDDRIGDECYRDYLNVDIPKKTEESCGTDDRIGNEPYKDPVNVDKSKRTKEPCHTVDRTGDESYKDVGVVVGTNTSRTTAESPKQKDRDGCFILDSAALGGPHNKDEDETAIACEGNAGKSICSSQVNHLQEQATLLTERDLKALGSDSTEVDMVDTVRPDATDCICKELIDGNKLCNMASGNQDGKPIGNSSLSTDSSKSRLCPVNLRSNLPTKDKLSEIALGVLRRKKDKLFHQQRVIEEEIAHCDETIQTILSSNEDDVALKIESILEDYNAGFLNAPQIQDSTYESSDGSLVHVKRKRLSEALENSCQELDSLCYENNWILPTYRVSPKDGGFEASLTVNVMDFKCSVHSKLHEKPHEARENAATQMLVKLRQGSGSYPVI